MFIIVTVGDLANEIQRDCGNVAGNIDSLFSTKQTILIVSLLN